MAGAAEGDQGRGAVGGGAVMNDERIRSTANAAEPMVAAEDLFAAPGEAAAVAAAAVVAGLAEPAAVELGVAARAAQRELVLGAGSHGGGHGIGPAIKL